MWADGNGMGCVGLMCKASAYHFFLRPVILFLLCFLVCIPSLHLIIFSK